MPHRPERPAGATSTTTAVPAAAAPTTAMYSPRIGNSTGNSIMAQQQQAALNVFTNAAGVVTPIAKSMGTAHHHHAVVVNAPRPPVWTFGSASTTGIHRRVQLPTRLLSANKSVDSCDRSTGTHKHQHDEESTVATLATEGTNDDLDKREQATASALLMVSATKPFMHETPSRGDAIPSTTEEESHKQHQPQQEEQTATASSVPLKKRKKHLDFLRRNQDSSEDSIMVPAHMEVQPQQQPFHISPVSDASHGGRGVGHTSSAEEATPERKSSSRSMAVKHKNTSHSYDSKEEGEESPPYRPTTTTTSQEASTQALPDSAKIHDAADIALKPPAHVNMPHFPSVLHSVLSDKEFANSVLQWLPNGEAWKVVRWDALRRQVLPLYFAELRDEDGKGCGTIDAFLWHLTAWGFEEVKDGTDAGAYRHDLFIRGAQKLCKKMRFTAIQAEDEHHVTNNNKGPTTVSPGRMSLGGGEPGDRSILQVPSLASTSRSDVDVNSPMRSSSPSKRTRYEDHPGVLPLPNPSIRRQSSPCPPGWPSTMIVNYHPEESMYADASNNAWAQYYGESPHGSSHHGMARTHHTIMGQYSSYDSRYNYRHHAPASEGVSRPQLSPSQQHQPQQSHSQYTPPRVRSTRGRLPGVVQRGSAPSPTATTTSAAAPPPQRSSFPVSNRGKGRRGASVCRSALPTANLSPTPSSGSTAVMERSSPSSVHSSSSPIPPNMEGQVAIAISRKTKRKLPMALKAATTTASASPTPSTEGTTAIPV